MPSSLRTFYHLLGNTLVASVINFTAWFAITFFVYLETRSVFATSIIAGIYLVFTAVTGFWFGSLVDHHKKKQVMIGSSAASLVFYALALAVYLIAGADGFTDVSSISLWVLVLTVMGGVMAGNIRTIAMSTTVTILIPEDRRDKANGLVGTAFGVSFLVTSVISGVLVGQGGMYYVLLLALAATAAMILHLWKLTIPEKGIVHVEGEPPASKKVDIRGTMKVVLAIPGLFALIMFTTFNNFLGGVFMALMDAYGLSIVSVETWGFLWGIVSTGFIIGGIVIAKKGLGKNPLRTMLLANVVLWIISIFFTIQASLILLTVGLFLYMCIMPYIEATEQTILQKVVPLERQGRVFGFAQSIEQAASPLTAFLIGPIAQFIFIPFMTTGAGVGLIGDWFGIGQARGIALVFILTGIVGLLVTLLAMASKQYRLLSNRYLNGSDAATDTQA